MPAKRGSPSNNDPYENQLPLTRELVLLQKSALRRFYPAARLDRRDRRGKISGQTRAAKRTTKK